MPSLVRFLQKKTGRIFILPDRPSKIPFGAFRRFLQSAARIICSSKTNKLHTCSLRCVFAHVHAAVENDLDGFAAFAANSAKPFSTL